MDLLERACTLATCPLFESLAPAVVIRLAERAQVSTLEPGERRTTENTVWVVACGSLAVVVREGTSDASASIIKRRGVPAIAGNALGMVRVVRPVTPAVEVIAERDSVLVGLAFDDVRDVLEEDASALSALADRLASVLLIEAS